MNRRAPAALTGPSDALASRDLVGHWRGFSRACWLGLQIGAIGSAACAAGTKPATASGTWPRCWRYRTCWRFLSFALNRLFVSFCPCFIWTVKFTSRRLLDYLERCTRENLYSYRIPPIAFFSAPKKLCHSPFQCFWVKVKGSSRCVSTFNTIARISTTYTCASTQNLCN